VMLLIHLAGIGSRIKWLKIEATVLIWKLWLHASEWAALVLHMNLIHEMGFPTHGSFFKVPTVDPQVGWWRLEFKTRVGSPDACGNL